MGATSPSLSVTATVSDGGTLSYQWYSNTTNSNAGGIAVSGATNASYAAPTTVVGTTYYYVVVTNTNNGQTSTATSNAVAVTVNPATPNITAQPTGATVNVGATSPSLSVTATVSDGGTLSYQWYSNTTNSNAGGIVVSGATNASYAAPTTVVGSTTYYYVVVTNTTNGQTSTATSNAVAVTVNPARPSITAQPKGATVNVGATSPSLSITATVNDGGTLSYQWYATNSNIEGTAVSGATNASYAAPTTVVGTTYYYVVVINTNNGRTAIARSNVVAVTVNPATPSAPTALSATAGNGQVTLTWSGVSGAVTYSVYEGMASGSYGSTPVATVTGSTYSYQATGLTNGTTYYFVVKASNAGGSSGNSSEASATPEPNLSVVYNSNGATSGSAPTDSGTYTPGVTVSVYGNNGNLVKVGYTFAGWNTAADGSGTSYSPGASFPMGASNVTLYAQWQSANALLSGLSVDQGTLTTAFSTSQSNYSVSVPYTVSSLNMFVTKGDPNQTLTVTGATYSSVTGNVYAYNASNLVVGSNPIQIVVTAQDLTQNTYTLTLNRAKSSNTDLSGLTLSSGTLTPAFSTGTSEYLASVGNSVSTITVTASVYDSNATMTVNNAAVASGQASGALNLNVGSNTINIIITAQDGTTKTYTVAVTRKAAHSSSSGSTSTGSSPSDIPAAFHLLVNGKEYNQIATGTTTEENGKTVLTAKVDADSLAAQLAQEGDRPVVTIPAATVNADKVDAVLTGDTVKAMENKQATLEVQTPNGNYKLPAEQIVIDRLASQLGGQAKLSDIVVHVEIAKSDAEKVKLVESSAGKGEFSIVVPPVDFTVTATYNGKTVMVDKFSSYVEREIPLPEGVDPKKVTTATVLAADGTVHHVPTRITLRDGKYYAVVNSLTNSTYTLIWHPVTFADVAGHWSQAAVNDMASRMIVTGADATHFKPDAAITRAEFAAIIVRALGLAEDGNATAFKDVKFGDWYAGAVAKAQEYGIIDGYEDGTFRPGQTITREEAMAIITRAIKITGLDASVSKADADAVLASFADGSAVDAWAKQAVAATVKIGLVSGSDAGLQPASNITRAETAAIVQRMLIKAKLIDSGNS
ncbi:S-layer homology domain-containing protein [Paenibacillus filicis]|uniref:S-layer homology domain-containing protein n=1 Tax=Paenibacillus gyeongsangnamensis TaxID=3388067 RepID=A0ABT4QF69_9BACL|nr:S-layer homology domain-containing protein [Paenibacillus filicis]MCZ8515513.1 S-layer homology domain-containing protein [Paenibacillus filicis]